MSYPVVIPDGATVKSENRRGTYREWVEMSDGERLYTVISENSQERPTWCHIQYVTAEEIRRAQ